jgi:hypothetical protein
MTTTTVKLAGLLEYWRRQRQYYDESLFALLLCGNESKIDRAIFNYTDQYAEMLDDMSGAYCVFAVLAGDRDEGADEEVAESLADDSSDERDLAYLHVIHPGQLDASTVYSVAHALGISLAELPVVIFTLDPWQTEEVAVYAIRNFVDDDNLEETITTFFRSVFTSCREVVGVRLDRKLRAMKRNLDQQLRENLARPPSRQSEGVASRIAKTGIIAEVVKGIVQGIVP